MARILVLAGNVREFEDWVRCQRGRIAYGRDRADMPNGDEARYPSTLDQIRGLGIDRVEVVGTFEKRQGAFQIAEYARMMVSRAPAGGYHAAKVEEPLWD